MNSLLTCIEQGCPITRERIDLENSTQEMGLSILHKSCPDHDKHWSYFIVPRAATPPNEFGVQFGTARIETNMRTWRGFAEHFQPRLVGENSDYGVAANRG